jgi:glycosyltransferase involved in cell wall biosynthesis
MSIVAQREEDPTAVRRRTAHPTHQLNALSPHPGVSVIIPTVSVVIPTLNEAANLPHVFARIPHWVHEVVVVDGQSTDGTIEVARSSWPNSHILTEERRRADVAAHAVLHERRGHGMVLRLATQDGRGKGAALRKGFAIARGDIIVMIDADGSTDPAEIPMFVGALLGGAHLAKGSRFLQGGGTADMPLYRRFGNGFFVWLVRILFGSRYSDLCYGYNAFWAWTIPLLHLDAEGFEIETMLNVRALRAGLKVAELPSFEAERLYGESRLKTFPDGWRVLKTIWRERITPLARQAPSAARPWDNAAGMAADRPRAVLVPGILPVGVHSPELVEAR